MIQIENEMHGASSKLGPGVVVIIFTKKIIYELKKKNILREPNRNSIQ